MNQIKALEIETSILFNWDFATSTILSCFSLFFSFIDLYFLIPAVITQNFNQIAERVIPIGIPTEGAKAKRKIHPVM